MFDQVLAGRVDEARLLRWEEEDNLFPHIEPAYYREIQQPG